MDEETSCNKPVTVNEDLAANDQPSSSSSGDGVYRDIDTSSDDFDEIEELPESEHVTIKRQNSKLSIDSVSLSGSDGLDLICVRRLAKSAAFRRKKSVEKEKSAKNNGDGSRSSKKRRKFWSFRFKKRLHGRLQRPREGSIADSQPKDHSCVCTEIRRTDEHILGAGIVFNAAAAIPRRNQATFPIETPCSSHWATNPAQLSHAQLLQSVPDPPNRSLIPCTGFDENASTLDCNDSDRGHDDQELPSHHTDRPNNDVKWFYPVTRIGESSGSQAMGASGHTYTANNAALIDATTRAELTEMLNNMHISFNQQSDQAESGGATAGTIGHYSPYRCLLPQSSYPYPHRVHTQVDYIHCLVPDLLEITNCGFYWGVMDRYEAERLLENRPEGTFLLRDSAQDEFLFSVSFRRYGRSLHARIEQWNHKFSFDSHDPGVFASNGVCGLIEHYKDPSCCMFFEPMLILPLNRTFPFTLQHICRSVICNRLTYDGISLLPLPKTLKEYLKYYHYKQKVRVRRFEHAECMPY